MSMDSEKLLWGVDFKSIDLADLNKEWNFDIGDGSQHGLVGWGNNELEYYTQEAVLLDSNLIINAKRTVNEANLDCYYGKALWTSGKIHTANKLSFKYGRIEVKAKMPKGVGTWPAIWLLGQDLLSGNSWPNCGEIDILETTGATPHQIQGTIHGPGYFGEAGLTKIIQAPNPLSEDFHVYAINWVENKIEWLFDGNVYNSISRSEVENQGHIWPFNQAFYLILNLAIGGWFAGEVDPNLSEAAFEIASINHFAINGVGEVFVN